RSLLGKLVWLGSALFGALASVPLVGSLVDPVVRGGRRARGKFVRAARLDALEPGVPRKVAIVGEVTDAWNRSPRRRLGAVWLVRGRGDEVTAFSVVCLHLGCGIDYRESDRSFRCPCHDSA